MNSIQENQNPFSPLAEETKIDFKRYLSLFLSNWYWFAGALFISLSIAYGINRWSEEIYTVSSTLLIKSDPAPGLSDIFPNSENYRYFQNLNNEIGILRSFQVNLDVMKELPDFYVVYTAVGKRGIAETRLYKTCPFIVTYESLEKQSFDERVAVKIISNEKYRIEIPARRNYSRELLFGERFNEMGFDFIVNLRDADTYKFNSNASNRYYFYFIHPISLANIYRKKLIINPVSEESSLISLMTSGPVATQEADYLNKLMEVYKEFGLDFKNKTVTQTIEFIEDQLKIISESLKEAEIGLEQFKNANLFIDISSEGEMIQRRLQQIDAEISGLDLQRRYYVYLKAYIDSKVDIEDIIAPSVMGITDQMLIGYVSDLARLQKQKKELGMSLSASQEPLMVLESNIISVRNAINENIREGMQNLEENLADAALKMRKIEAEARKLPTTERQMINIQRKFEINNTVYTYLLEKRAEAGIARASTVSDNREIDIAGPHTTLKIKPRTRNNLTLAFILGLFIPVLAILILDYLHNRIIDKKDIEKGTKAPVIGFISHNVLDSEIPVAQKPGSALAESFRSIRTNLKYFTKDIRCPVIAVSSTITSEGKTFISANLAAIMALSGKKVLLVGLDLRKPRIHKIFEVRNETGLSNYLIGQEKFEDVITRTNIENLWYAASGPIPPNPAELIDSPEMTVFIEKAKEQYEYIIIDTPPFAVVTDAILCSHFSDFYLFVVRQRFTSKNTLNLIEELYTSKKLRNIGIVINDISLSGYYGYGLRYGYSFGYGYSYGYNYYGKYSDRLYGYSDSSKDYYREE